MEPAAASTSSSSDEERHCNDFMEASSTMSRRRAPSEWDEVAGVICCDDDEWFRYRVVVALRVLDPPPLDDSFAVEVRLLVFPATIIPPPRCSDLWSNDDDETTHDLLHDVHPSSTAAPWTRQQHRGGAQAPAVVDPLLSPTALAQLVTPTTTTRTSWQSREEDDRGGREPPIELLVFPARRLVFSPHSSLSDDEKEEVHDDDPLLSLSSSSSSNNSEDDDEAQVVMCETCVRLRRLIIDADKSRERLAADLSDALSMLGEVLGSRHAAATHHPYAVSSLEILPSSSSWSTDAAIEMARRRILESPPAPSFATDEEESESPDDESCSVWRVLKFEEEDQDDDNNICKADKQQEEKEEEEEEEQSDAHQQQRKKKSRHGCRMLFPLLCGCLRRAAFAPKSNHLLVTVMIEAGALALHLSAQKIVRRQPRRPPPKVIPTSS